MRTILICIACISLLHAQGRKLKLSPALDAAVERIRIGELTSVRGPELVVGTFDAQTRKDYLKAQKANDKEGISELMSAGRIAALSPNTEIRVLERDEAGLDQLMDTVYQLMNLEAQGYRSCMERNVRRAYSGLPYESCGNLTFESSYNSHLKQCLYGASPEAYVDSHVFVLVRVLSGTESGKKLWVPYDSLTTPSHPDPTAKQ